MFDTFHIKLILMRSETIHSAFIDESPVLFMGLLVLKKLDINKGLVGCQLQREID